MTLQQQLSTMLARARARGYTDLLWYLSPTTEYALAQELGYARSYPNRVTCFMDVETFIIKDHKTHAYIAILGRLSSEWALGLDGFGNIKECRYRL